MSPVDRKIFISVLLIIFGVLVLIFPVFSRVLSAAVAFAGILYAAAIGVLYRNTFRTPRIKALAFAACIIAAAGILLILNILRRFIDGRILLLAELVAMGLVTLGLGLYLRERRLDIWLSVLIAGVGTIAAGLCALIIAEAAITVGCVTAAVIMLYPLCAQAIINRKTNAVKKDKKIITVKEKDIEVIPEERDEKK